jgi:hypothetical protein
VAAAVAAWRDQFDQQDRGLAARLAELLHVVSADEFGRSMERLVQQVAVTFKGPVALVPVRALRPGAAYYRPARSRWGRAQVLSPSRLPGSEAICARLATNLVRASGGTLVAGHSLARLREVRSRAILLLEDVVGSGDRIIGFLDALYRSTTIKSWMSLEYIRPIVVTYAATDQGLHALANRWPQIEVRYVRRAPTLMNSNTDKTERSALADLCVRYAIRAGKRDMALGYQDSASLLVFAHGCPNNVPAIVWHRSRRWAPLFPSRGVPARAAAELAPQNPARAVRNALRRLGEFHAAEALPVPRLSPRATNAILVLMAVSRHLRRADIISDATELPVPTCEDMLDDLHAWGLITRHRYLTARGSSELRAVRRRRAAVEKPDFHDALYYPRSLR